MSEFLPYFILAVVALFFGYLVYTDIVDRKRRNKSTLTFTNLLSMRNNIATDTLKELNEMNGWRKSQALIKQGIDPNLVEEVKKKLKELS